jgi:chorismate mutase
MTQSVEDLRVQIDTLDNQLHDLLMERAELVLKIGEAKRRNKIQVVQPDREIIMLRRLLARQFIQPLHFIGQPFHKPFKLLDAFAVGSWNH